MIRLTVRQMEYFDALAQTRHFGRAAELAGVTQPALSAQIAEMEQRLGCRLFERGGKAVGMTEDGRALQPRIEAILDEIRDLESTARRGRLAMEGKLRLGIIPTVAPYILPKILPELRGLFPSLTLELREAVTRTLIDETLGGRIDAALVALPIEEAGLAAEPVFEDTFLLAIPASEPGFVTPPVPPESPVLERLMLLEEGHCMRDQALAVCGNARPAAMANYGATSLTTLLQMVAHGFGVTLIPSIALPSAGEMRDVRIVPFAEPAPARTLGLVWRRGSARGNECAALATTLKRLFGSDEAGDVKSEPEPDRQQGKEADDEGGLAVADAVGSDVDRGVNAA
ncbi:LysR family transcriptional regulator, hydrogen peroxide-inducible genes activator [Mesorhizobium australicum]|uniref:LysR family transcriptional regulator, hydrogen peroxide-inducible genes activator n=1 Tax=Mesorhizobium australicum TaxID=536018 RepID=A0A1X7NS58_9HYPH|nr:LysR family transcriptional regulator, hydrogen peroxide-inducible genes activator [Mesorhizobium australicum]